MIRFPGISDRSSASHPRAADWCRTAPINVMFDLFQFDADHTVDILKIDPRSFV